LSNLVRGKKHIRFNDVKMLVPVFSKYFINENIEDIGEDVLWAIGFLTDGENKEIDYVLEESGNKEFMIKKLIDCANSNITSYHVPLTRILGNFATSSDIITE